VLAKMFESRENRVVGWAIVLLLVAAWGLSLWLTKPGYKVIEPSPDRLRKLATLPKEEYAEWLTDFVASVKDDAHSWQALIVQAVPGEAPIVLATAQGSSDEEGAVNWNCPWPAVVEVLDEPILQPIITEGSYANVNYQHLLIPLDETGLRCVLVNQMLPSTAIAFSFRTPLIVGAILLGLALLVAGRQ